MRLWEVTLPTHDNDGVRLHMAHKHFKARLLNRYGGYTERTQRGAWRDPASGVVYTEASIAYTVANPDEDDDIGPAIPWDLFPDQLAIMVADLGDADIRNRSV